MPTLSSPYIGQGNLTPYSKSEIIRRMLWSCVQATVFRWSPRFCHRWRVMLLGIFGANVPEPGRVRIYPTAEVVFPWKLRLEPETIVGPGVRLYNLAHVTLEYGANISQHAHLCSGTHDYRFWAMPLVAKPIVVGRNVWIGAEVFVGPGVTIGELAVVGARSVVTKDLPPRKVCVGHPCRPIKDRPDPG